MHRLFRDRRGAVGHGGTGNHRPNRFEHEMDTTKAVASWRRVVEDNLEKKARENAAAGV
ncbi:hypothetical protein GS582_20780 [Rhodococcus hoagii]|nr:hypothetical protein [Prescottella equi]